VCVCVYVFVFVSVSVSVSVSMRHVCALCLLVQRVMFEERFDSRSIVVWCRSPCLGSHWAPVLHHIAVWCSVFCGPAVLMA